MIIQLENFLYTNNISLNLLRQLFNGPDPIHNRGSLLQNCLGISPPTFYLLYAVVVGCIKLHKCIAYIQRPWLESECLLFNNRFNSVVSTVLTALLHGTGVSFTNWCEMLRYETRNFSSALFFFHTLNTKPMSRMSLLLWRQYLVALVRNARILNLPILSLISLAHILDSPLIWFFQPHFRCRKSFHYDFQNIFFMHFVLPQVKPILRILLY